MRMHSKCAKGGCIMAGRAALQTGLAQKRKSEGEEPDRSSKKQSSMMSAVLGDLSGESSDEDS